jgi:hypothetical protein
MPELSSDTVESEYAIIARVGIIIGTAIFIL